MQRLPGVSSVVFDQCMVGLVSPSGNPMRKRTRLLTNSQAVVSAFSNKMCDCSHCHQIIQGSDMGIKLSVWAQKYPENMCDLLAQRVVDTLINVTS